MALPAEKQRVAEFVREIEQIEENCIELFSVTALLPAEKIEQPEGELIVLRWRPDTQGTKTSRLLRRRYETWYHAALALIEEFLPYQERDFRASYDTMISYITLNRYAATTEHALVEVNTRHERGYVDVYLREFAEVVDTQANLLRSILHLSDNEPGTGHHCFVSGMLCTQPLRENPNLLFALMPFSDEDDDRYQLGIKEAARSVGLQCQRADEIRHTQNVICRAVCQPIRAARYVVADITERNPNVFYELGLTHGRCEDVEQVNKRVILLTRDIETTPFDLRNMNIIEYDSIGSLRANLRTTLLGLLAEFEPEQEAELAI